MPAGALFTWLDQTQFCCPFDGRPAIIDVEFAVDALGMGADRAQGDHEFIGDLRPGKLGFEQAENFKLTLAERLDQGLRSVGSDGGLPALDLDWPGGSAWTGCCSASNAASSLPV